MGKKVGPNALEDLLAQLGLEITKTRNEIGQGKRPELIMCEHFNIFVADPTNQWADRELEGDEREAEPPARPTR
jgi:hypothetical protein